MTKQRLDDMENGRDRPVIEVTPAMVEAGLRVLRECGLIEHPGLIDGSLVRKVLWVALAAR